jgi:CheY-like chemotaxis protein
MSQNSEPSRARADLLTTTVLFIDDHTSQRAYWADQLKECSHAYEILEASDAQSGLALCQSRQIDCVVLELDLPDQSGFEVLVQLVPLASRPYIPVIALTRIPHLAVRELAKDTGAYACFSMQEMTVEALDTVIQQAAASVRRARKADRHRRNEVNEPPRSGSLQNA